MQKIRYIVPFLFGLLCYITGCDSVLYDDLSDCPQGVNFGFYSQTPCESGKKYPAEISQVRVFVFDENNVMVEEFAMSDIKISADFWIQTSFNRVGTFTFVAWGGTDLSTYDFTPFKKGETKKNELFVAMQRQSDKFNDTLSPIYWGEAPPLTIEDRTNMGSVFDWVTFNMQVLTNRINITIHGLSENDNYSVTITDDNGVYDFNGDFAYDTRFDYITSVRRDGKMIKANFTVMKLGEKRNPRLTITNLSTGKVVYEVNMVDDLIMYRGDSGEPPYKLECDHDFNIIIVFNGNPETPETYILMNVKVNDWNVITRPVVLG